MSGYKTRVFFALVLLASSLTVGACQGASDLKDPPANSIQLIEKLVFETDKALADGDVKTFYNNHDAAYREAWRAYSSATRVTGTLVQSVRNIAVNGRKATAEVLTSLRDGVEAREYEFRFEDKKWRIHSGCYRVYSMLPDT